MANTCFRLMAAKLGMVLNMLLRGKQKPVPTYFPCKRKKCRFFVQMEL